MDVELPHFVDQEAESWGELSLPKDSLCICGKIRIQTEVFVRNTT